MRKHVSLLFLCVLLQLCGRAQDSISFNMHYLPMHEYDMAIVQQSGYSTTYSGSDSVLAFLKDRGISNPTIVNHEINGTAVTTTGAYDKSGKMPVQLLYQKLTAANGDILIPAGSGLLGTMQKDSMPVFDSVIVSDQNDIKTKNILMKVKDLVSQIHLPAARMKLGDEYVYTTPVSIPVANTIMKMVMSITYKLTNVTDSMAGFDLTMKINFDMQTDSVTSKSRGTGSGGGTLIYDRINSFPIKEDLHYSMEMLVENKGINVKVEATSKSSHNYTIRKI